MPTTTLPRLYNHINQSGITTGPKKLALMQQACRLMEVPLSSENLDAEGDAISTLLRVKLFNPCGGWTWYIQDWDGEDTCFGWVEGIEPEWGYFSLHELSEVEGPIGIGLEVDFYFTPSEREAIVNT
jgi:hypothetical protein